MIVMRWAAVAACFVVAAPAGAVPLNAFSSFYVLGDSLSDVGNVYDASLHREPASPPYWHGRFTNGPNWADRVADAFDAQGVRADNLAWGGALADGGAVPDIGMQASQYRLLDRDKRGDRPLVAIWGGGNDIIQSAGKKRAREDARDAAAAIGDAARTLARSGAEDIMIFDLPDLGKIPKFRGNAEKSPSASAASRVFNRRLAIQVDRLRDRGVAVYQVGAAALFQSLLDDPASFGITNVTKPCYDDGDLCSRRQQSRWAFFDSIHPNRTVHRALADAALASLKAGPSGSRIATLVAAPAPATVAAPVPLPASGLMLVAALGLGGVWFRRRAA